MTVPKVLKTLRKTGHAGMRSMVSKPKLRVTESTNEPLAPYRRSMYRPCQIHGSSFVLISKSGAKNCVVSWSVIKNASEPTVLTLAKVPDHSAPLSKRASERRGAPRAPLCRPGSSPHWEERQLHTQMGWFSAIGHSTDSPVRPLTHWQGLQGMHRAAALTVRGSCLFLKHT